ncbi:MAG TPA: VanZ family protein [Chitinophagaceae bacterium]|nr:VanZ family protein [Chitinophagaceae bacterium]
MNDQYKSDKASRRTTIVLFIIYLVALWWILLLKLGVQFSYMKKRRANLIPFDEPSLLTSENILNVIVFIPLGIYAGMLFERWSFGKKFLVALLLSVLVEGLQYILRLGAFDATDIVTNTLGGVIGLVIFIVLGKAFKSGLKTRKVINTIAAIGTFLMIVLLVLLKMNMLPIRYQ